jgi:hypothetical protein
MQEDQAFEAGLVARMAAARDAIKIELGGLKRGRAIEHEVQAWQADLVRQGQDARAAAVGDMLLRYTEAINEAWLYVENSGITAKLVKAWVKRKKGYVSQIDFSEAWAEGTMLVRDGLTTIDALRNNASLMTALSARLFHGLDEWLAQSQSPVTLPREEARRNTNRYGKFPNG